MRTWASPEGARDSQPGRTLPGLHVLLAARVDGVEELQTVFGVEFSAPPTPTGKMRHRPVRYDSRAQVFGGRALLGSFVFFQREQWKGRERM